MSNLKSYTCAKCGAVLSVDKLQGQMACPFCGNEFDYVDFHRDELIRQAEECLARGAYEPAREKFNKVLENNPKDIEAIRGAILSAGRVPSTEYLKDRYNRVSSDLDGIKKIVISAKEHVTENDCKYLDNLVSLFEIPIVYSNTEERKKNTMRLERKRDLQLDYHYDNQGSLGVLLAFVICIMYVLVGISIYIFTEQIESIGWFFFLLLPLQVFIVGGYVFLYKKFKVNIVSIPESSKSMSDKLGYYEATYSEIISEVLEYEARFMKKTERKEIVREEKKPDPVHSAEISGPVICAKCGGFLKLNNSQELYECNSCGVSYGKYLFFGDLAENASRAMAMGEFDEADQILSHKLMANPKDFDALLGRFLCAGKWRSLEDIDIDDSLFMSHIRGLPERLDAIEKRISKDNQPLWEDIRKYSDLLGEYAEKIHDFNKQREKYKSLSGKLKNDYLMKNEIKDFKRQRAEVMTELSSLDIELTELGGRIDEAKTVFRSQHT